MTVSIVFIKLKTEVIVIHLRHCLLKFVFVESSSAKMFLRNKTEKKNFWEYTETLYKS